MTPPLISLQRFLDESCTVAKPPRALLAHHERVVLYTNSNNVYANLATEEALMRAVVLAPAQVLLLCYVNTSCVVVGRNQNVFAEVALRSAHKAGVRVARRYSGGGAVYHDTGNLCLSFLTTRRAYDPARTTALVRDALCARFGLDPARLTTTTRHDLFLDGRKITGSAMRVQKDVALHHCTLLVDSVGADVGAYLRPEGQYTDFVSPSTPSIRAPVTTLAERGLLDTCRHSHVHATTSALGTLRTREDVEVGMTAAVCALRGHVAEFFLRHGTVGDDTATAVLDVAACHTGVDCVLRYGEGRSKGTTRETVTLRDEVRRLGSQEWRVAMPRFTSVVAVTEDELRAELRNVCVGHDVAKYAGVQDAVLRLLFPRDGADAACTLALHLRTTVDHRRITALQVCVNALDEVRESGAQLRTSRTEPSSSWNGAGRVTNDSPAHTATTCVGMPEHASAHDASSARVKGSCATTTPELHHQPRPTPLPWLEAVLQTLLCGTACDATHLDYTAPTGAAPARCGGGVGATLEVVRQGMKMEMSRAGVVLPESHEIPLAVCEEAMLLLVYSTWRCWRHKNVFDVSPAESDE